MPEIPTFEPLSLETMRLATRFAMNLIDDRNFTHFRHTLPEHMLTDKWEVYLMIYAEMVLAWGQIEKFPGNPHKQHVARLGFAVLPEYRSYGLGGKLADYIIGRCAGYSKLTANVFLDNTIMLSMFIKRDFVIEGCFLDEEKNNHEYRHVVCLARYQK